MVLEFTCCEFQAGAKKSAAKSAESLIERTSAFVFGGGLGRLHLGHGKAVHPQIETRAARCKNEIKEQLVPGRTLFAQILNIAEGSLAEAEYQLLLGRDLGYVTQPEVAALITEADEIGAMLYRFRIKVEPGGQKTRGSAPGGRSLGTRVRRRPKA